MATIQFSEGVVAPAPLPQQKQLLNNIIDGMARIRPWALYAEVPNSLTTYEAGFRKITYGNLANAINCVAWWLKEELGTSQNFETLSYLGPSDLRYVFMLLGAVKAGYKLLLASPRNTIPAYISLFEALECKILITPPGPTLPVVDAILKAHQLRLLRSPGEEELFERTQPHYPFRKTFEEARSEPLVVVHTSGTTSLPKPIIYTHDFAASYIQSGQLVPPAGFESQVQLVQGNRLFVTLPAFHAGNLFATLFDAIANQTTVIIPLAGVLPSAKLVSDALKHIKADAVLLAPPYMEQIAKDSTMLDIISSNCETAAYGGGDISQAAGDMVTTKIRLFNFNGSTETGSYPTLRPTGKFPAEDWKYIHPHPASGLKFRAQPNGVYEAFIIRNPDFEQEQPVFKIFPRLQEYATKDLFSPHPSKPDLWTYHGRADDIIIFKTGMLTNPIAMEQHVGRHPKVQGAVMAGTGRFQPCLLIELERELEPQPLPGSPSTPPPPADSLLEDLWPIIEQANQTYTVDSRIAKSHIVFTEPEKPMQRAGKGTVQRAPTLELYRDELDALYDRAGDRLSASTYVPTVAGGVIPRDADRERVE